MLLNTVFGRIHIAFLDIFITKWQIRLFWFLKILANR